MLGGEAKGFFLISPPTYTAVSPLSAFFTSQFQKREQQQRRRPLLLLRHVLVPQADCVFVFQGPLWRHSDTTIH